MWLESVRESTDHTQECPTCGSHVQRRPYGEMHAGSQILDGQRVDIRRRPADGFADPIVLDPLAQYFDGRVYRIWPNERYFALAGRRLHRVVWERAFGPIPHGCHIHHRDGNTGNNRLVNLESVPAVVHLSESSRKRVAPFFTAASRAKCLEWHQSDVGRLWHSRNGKRQKGWLKWKREEKPCAHCGRIVQMLVRRSGNAQKYCTDTCKALAYRKRHGIDWKGRRVVPDGS